MSQTRRLAAILAADVAGYSRLMGADEEGTHERLKAHLGELVNPKIGEHRGRVVKNTGDGLLAEFASVVDAVRCAVEIQRGMVDREPAVPEERRIDAGPHYRPYRAGARRRVLVHGSVSLSHREVAAISRSMVGNFGKSSVQMESTAVSPISGSSCFWVKAW